MLVYFFGGGWILGTIDTADAVCRSLANLAQCLVVAVGYRLAPEHKFPAAVDDCYAATQWMARRARDLGADRHRIAVGGDSAGGNLAAVVAQLCRDGAPVAGRAPVHAAGRGAVRAAVPTAGRGALPTPGRVGDAGGLALAGQLLVYPNTDYGATISAPRNADPYMFNRTSVDWYWGHYLSSPADGLDPRASPLRAADLSRLPPALVITAEYDPLRDQAERYARAMRHAGVSVTLTRYPGMVHGFFCMAGELDAGREAHAEAAAHLRTWFSA